MNKKSFQCNTKGKRCNPMEEMLKIEKGQITTAMRMTEVKVKGKKTFALQLEVGYKPTRKGPIYMFEVCPFCEGRLRAAAA